jgi:hypothetical protein
VPAVAVDPTGRSGPTQDEATGPRWRRTSRGRYVPASVDGSVPEQRVLEQSARLPEHGAVTGWAALRMAGATFFDGLETDGRTRQPVPLAVGPGTKIRGDASATVSREPLAPGEVVLRHGVPCTRVVRALFDEMRRVPDWREAVVALDMAAAADLVSVRQLTAYVAGHSRWRRTAQVRRALPHASELSRSPNETRLRLIWVLDAGLPAPLVNCEVFTRQGRLLGVADLFDPVAGLVGEFDGADHRGARRHSQDVAREEGFRRAGLEVVTVTGPDLPRRQLVVDRLRSVRARARFLPEEDSAWTLVPPPEWDVPEPLDALIERRAWMREVHGSW